MSYILLKNIQLDGAQVDIHIKDGVFHEIVPTGTVVEGVPGSAQRVDCTAKAAVPAFVNMHIHAGMSLMRGVGEDIVFADWIDRIWKLEAGINSEYVYWATKASCIEMLRTGTVTFNDHYWYPTTGHCAAIEMGLRPVNSYVVCDKFDLDEAEREKDQIQRMYEQSLLWPEHSYFAAGFHAIYSVSEQMILWISEFARKRGLKLHFHLSETRPEIENCKAAHGGLSPVEYLEELGVLDENCIAAHTLWLSDKDVEILGRRKVNCVHNINSNMKLASGYKFRYNELKQAGANVCIGTDGCASSNNLDLLEAMKTAALVQKAWRDDPSAMPLEDLFNMATVNGAKALGLNVGRICKGALADMLIVDTDNTFFLSPAPFLANLLYSAHSSCVQSVISNGRFVMADRVVEGEKEILAQARRLMSLKDFVFFPTFALR